LCSLIWKIGILVICALLILACIPYFVLIGNDAGKHSNQYVTETNNAGDPVTSLVGTPSKLTSEDYVITVIAVISLLITAAIGIVAVFKNSRQWLLLWIVIMGVMFLFGLLQLILFYSNVGIIVPKANQTSGSSKSIFVVATIIIMIVAALGFTFGFLLRWRVVRKKEAQANFYE